MGRKVVDEFKCGHEQHNAFRTGTLKKFKRMILKYDTRDSWNHDKFLSNDINPHASAAKYVYYKGKKRKIVVSMMLNFLKLGLLIVH